VVVHAPIREVWSAIEDVDRHAAWHPFVTRIEGVHVLGAPRVCSVIVGNKAGTTRERCVKLEEERTIRWAIEEDTSGFARMVSDWHAGFSVRPDVDGTRVTAESVFTPKSIPVRLMGPLVRRKFHKAQQAILAGLKDASEHRS
jgi:uncharacterized protein YndB with AHSA1/START domain